jgi:hypothetical protein
MLHCSLELRAMTQKDRRDAQFSQSSIGFQPVSIHTRFSSRTKLPHRQKCSEIDSRKASSRAPSPLTTDHRPLPTPTQTPPAPSEQELLPVERTAGVRVALDLLNGGRQRDQKQSLLRALPLHRR